MRPLFFLFLLSVHSFALPSEEADYKLEDRFHQIYLKYNSAPVSEGEWNQAYGVSQPREYSISRSDTLWDISQVLFADPVFWPKIWSLNSTDILNPHEIFPGMKIRFFPGTLEAPPAFEITEAEGVELPPSKKRAPVSPVPPSLPSYLPEIPLMGLPKFQKVDRSSLSRIPPLPLSVEIMSERPESVGRVVEIEEGLKIADASREIFVQLNSDVRPGTFTVVREPLAKGPGYVIQYQGEIRILESINDSENVYRARITQLLNPLSVGDRILMGDLPMVDVSPQQRAVEVPLVRIIGGFSSPSDTILSSYSFIFLAGGAEEGLRVGDVLNIYQEPSARVKYTKQKKNYKEIGTVKVIRVQDRVATGYILSSSSEIREGDLAGIERATSGSLPIDETDELILE
jgi:hypothetical protein